MDCMEQQVPADTVLSFMHVLASCAMNVGQECDEYGAYYHHTEFRRDEHPAGPRSVMNTEHITTIQDSGEMNIMQGLGG